MKKDDNPQASFEYTIIYRPWHRSILFTIIIQKISVITVHLNYRQHTTTLKFFCGLFVWIFFIHSLKNIIKMENNSTFCIPGSSNLKIQSVQLLQQHFCWITIGINILYLNPYIHLSLSTYFFHVYLHVKISIGYKLFN